MKKILVTFAGLAMAGAALAQVDPTRPMITGRGNVSARPDAVIVTNQTSTTTTTTTTTKTEEPVQLDKFQVTGSLLPHAAAPKK